MCRSRRKILYFAVLKYTGLTKKKNFLLCSFKICGFNRDVAVLGYTNSKKENLLLSQEYKMALKA